MKAWMRKEVSRPIIIAIAYAKTAWGGYVGFRERVREREREREGNRSESNNTCSMESTAATVALAKLRPRMKRN